MKAFACACLDQSAAQRVEYFNNWRRTGELFLPETIRRPPTTPIGAESPTGSVPSSATSLATPLCLQASTTPATPTTPTPYNVSTATMLLRSSSPSRSETGPTEVATAAGSRAGHKHNLSTITDDGSERGVKKPMRFRRGKRSLTPDGPSAEERKDAA